MCTRLIIARQIGSNPSGGTINNYKGEITMIKDRNYYEIRLAKLIANGETMNGRLINKIRRKLRGLPA